MQPYFEMFLTTLGNQVLLKNMQKKGLSLYEKILLLPDCCIMTMHPDTHLVFVNSWCKVQHGNDAVAILKPWLIHFCPKDQDSILTAFKLSKTLALNEVYQAWESLKKCINAH